MTIWDEWADETATSVPIYGYQWRSWPTPDGGHVDQVAQVIEAIRRDPDSRGTSSPPGTSPTSRRWRWRRATLFQFYVAEGRLTCQLYQRSADVFLGVPFNIASYALLTHMVAQVTGLEVGDFVHTSGDAHLYSNHLDQARLQLTREPRPLPTPGSTRRSPTSTRSTSSTSRVEGYDPHPASRPRSPYERCRYGGQRVVMVAAVARNGVIGLAATSPGPASPRTSSTSGPRLKGHTGADGAGDLRVDRAAAALPHQRRGHPAARLERRRGARGALGRGGARRWPPTSTAT